MFTKVERFTEKIKTLIIEKKTNTKHKIPQSIELERFTKYKGCLKQKRFIKNNIKAKKKQHRTLKDHKPLK